jgi:CubicO group peptidase (beta-lactamase class C family)
MNQSGPVRKHTQVIYGLMGLMFLAALPSMALGQTDNDNALESDLIPVSVASNGFTAEMTRQLRQGFMWQTAYHTVDENLYYFLHWEEFVKHHFFRRSGAVSNLESVHGRQLGLVSANSSLGDMTLTELLADSRSRVQGFIVVHRGKIVYEQYPGMREDDHHIWNSISKTIAGLSVGLLEAEGKINVNDGIETYLPELSGTYWEGMRIIDILDMSTGLDLVENEVARNDVKSTFNKFWRIELGDRSGLGDLSSDEILFGVDKIGEAGKVFEYSSMNTKMLGILVERVANQRLAEFFSDRVWSKIGAEGDAMVGVNLEGGAAIYGMVSSRLRDLARYGMLFSPSWNVVASEAVIPKSLLDAIQNTCRPELLANSGRAVQTDLAEDQPICNSRQWDRVYADGDIYKGGARGQGLYVSPGRDVVVGWFSTTMEGSWVNYARAIAKKLGQED